MTRESSGSLLSAHAVKQNVYLSLVVANLLFGWLHPEHIVIAAVGAAFFTVSGLVSLRGD